MIFNSIRWRFQAWHGLILVTVLSAFGLTSYRLVQENQLHRIDQELEGQLMIVLRPPMPAGPPDRSPPGPPGPPEFRDGPEGPGFPRPQEPPPGRGEPRPGLRESIRLQAARVEAMTNAPYYYVLWENGAIRARSANAPESVPFPGNAGAGRAGSEMDREPRADSPRAGGARTRGDRRELFRPVPRGGCVLIGRSMAADNASMRRLAWWFASAGSSVLLLGLAGGWWMAARAIRPIQTIGATALKISGGDLSQRIDVAETESELGRLAQVLNSTFARLEAAFANQARFSGDASHELRTPISVILSQAQTALSRERPAPEYREALEACLRAAQRMRTLTESLLQLARLDAGQEPIKRVPFDLARVARDCAGLVAPLAAERGIAIQSDPTPEIRCDGDPERIAQVITNLLTNAIQFNHERGEIRIAVWGDRDNVLLSVADTGAGISPEDIPHLFERFYRADPSRSRVRGNTGLGLAIAKAIVDSHGGTISVSSRPGAGATFTVALPRNAVPSRG